MMRTFQERYDLASEHFNGSGNDEQECRAHDATRWLLAWWELSAEGFTEDATLLAERILGRWALVECLTRVGGDVGDAARLFALEHSPEVVQS